MAWQSDDIFSRRHEHTKHSNEDAVQTAAEPCSRPVAAVVERGGSLPDESQLAEATEEGPLRIDSAGARRSTTRTTAQESKRNAWTSAR